MSDGYADTLESGGPKDLLAIDGKGRVYSRRGRKMRVGFYYGLLATLVGVEAYIGYTLAGVPGLGIAAGLGALVGWKFELMNRYKRAAKAAADTQLEEAERLFTSVVKRRLLPVGLRARAYDWLAQIASLRNDYALALEHTRAALSHHGRRSHAFARLSRYSEVSLLARLDRLEEARALFSKLDDEAPEGEVLRLRHYGVELYLAFREGQHHFDDEALHERAQFALGITVAGPLLGLLSWAFDQNGDAEMSELLAKEARERPGNMLEKRVPEVFAWLERRRDAPQVRVDVDAELDALREELGVEASPELERKEAPPKKKRRAANYDPSA